MAQRLEDDAVRVMRAQLFAEFHQKMGEKDSEAAGLRLKVSELASEIEALRAKTRKEVQKSLLVVTTEAERSRLQKVLAQDENDVIMDVFIANASAKIIVMNLWCLRAGEWLNSETINVYVQMIEVAAKAAGCNVTSFNSFFMAKLDKEVMSDSWLLLTIHLTPHTSHLTPHTSHLTPHTSHLTTHTSNLTPHTSHLTPHRATKESELGPENSRRR